MEIGTDRAIEGNEGANEELLVEGVVVGEEDAHLGTRRLPR